MPRISIGDIVDLVDGEYSGDRSGWIDAVRPLGEAGAHDLSFLASPRYEAEARSSSAGAILVRRDLIDDSPPWIRVEDPYYALACVLQKWFSEVPRPSGISERASIATTVRIGEQAAIGDWTTIGEGAVIGNRVTIHDNVSIGPNVVIGDDCIIYPNATLYHGVRIGSRCIIHASAVIGSDGFGFATHQGVHHKILQIGIVRIEDDVEIGAGTTIDRAALGETVIGQGTKIDNLVQIAHNVRVGKGCFIAAQAGIAGSTEIGDYCAFGGQSGATGHVRLGSRVMVSGRSVVMKSVAGPGTFAGTPARPLMEQRRREAMIGRLPRLIERIRAIERALGIEKKDSNDESSE